MSSEFKFAYNKGNGKSAEWKTERQPVVRKKRVPIRAKMCG